MLPRHSGGQVLGHGALLCSCFVWATAHGPGGERIVGDTHHDHSGRDSDKHIHTMLESFNVNVSHITTPRDYYVSDADDTGLRTIKWVPAGGFAPRRTCFLARVTPGPNHVSVDMFFDETLRQNLQDVLVREYLYHLLAAAAQEGRFIHTNGGTAHLVNAQGDLVVLDFQEATLSTRFDEPALNYLATYPAHSVPDVAQKARTEIDRFQA
jgi:hypothetical protein